MPRQRVAVLYDIWWDDDDTPPEKPRGGKPRKREKEVHEEVYATLKKLGYQPFYCVLDGEPKSLAKLASSEASDSGSRLKPVATFSAMWFAWASFNRGTDVFRK